VSLFRFRDGRGERLDVMAKGTTVTWRVVPLDVHAPRVKAKVELAPDAEQVDEVAARIERDHRAAGFVELSEPERAAALATLAPFARWRALSAGTIGEYFAYLDAGAALASFASRVRSIDHDRWEIALDGGVAMAFALPAASVDDDPAPVRAYWARHASITAERDGFEVVLGRDAGPPEPEFELRRFSSGAAQWVMSRGTEQFWFLANDGTLRLCDLDGGVGPPIATSLGAVWLTLIADL
jgi:hypothetical protein